MLRTEELDRMYQQMVNQFSPNDLTDLAIFERVTQTHLKEVLAYDLALQTSVADINEAVGLRR